MAEDAFRVTRDVLSTMTNPLELQVMLLGGYFRWIDQIFLSLNVQGHIADTLGIAACSHDVNHAKKRNKKYRQSD